MVLGMGICRVCQQRGGKKEVREVSTRPEDLGGWSGTGRGREGGAACGWGQYMLANVSIWTKTIPSLWTCLSALRHAFHRWVTFHLLKNPCFWKPPGEFPFNHRVSSPHQSYDRNFTFLWLFLVFLHLEYSSLVCLSTRASVCIKTFGKFLCSSICTLIIVHKDELWVSLASMS